MHVSRVELKDFTVFEDATLELASGVNVFVGRNSTGKTHAMKALYSLVRANSQARQGAFSAAVAAQLREVFKPDGGSLGRLGQRRQGQKTFRLRAVIGRSELFVQVYSRDERVSSRATLAGTPSAVFIPSREALAMHDGFIRVYERRELAFDGTYYDLAKALTTPPLRGMRPGGIGEVVAGLQQALGGRLTSEGERFYLVGPGGARFEAHLMSEGLRKVGSLLRLLQNGEIEAGSILFWDEPEANLNPALAVFVAEALVALAKAGVQIVLATHDYFVSETIGLRARQRGAPTTRFFAFVRASDLAVQVTHADAIDDLAENAIREESLRHYDRLRGASE